MLPYWRHVKYTDDGCSIYQCIECKHTYEGRTSPGKYFHYELDGTQRVVPVYVPTFRFCPFCGVEWVSSIYDNYDNEYMYGPKRLRRDLAIQRLRHVSPPELRWYWVVEKCMAARGENELWAYYYKIDPLQFGAKAVYELLLKLRQTRSGTFRVVTVKVDNDTRPHLQHTSKFDEYLE